MMTTAQQIIEAITEIASTDRRTLIAIAGPPASGKSTLAQPLSERLGACVVPMDGFHLDNARLRELGLLESKGAPNTFDHHGFTEAIDGLKSGKLKHFPLFDRELDCVIDGGVVADGVTILLIEGNYLLFDDPDWAHLAARWDASIWLDVPDAVLEARLTQRWCDHGMSKAKAQARAQANDLVNARLVKANPLPATWVMGICP